VRIGPSRRASSFTPEAEDAFAREVDRPASALQSVDLRVLGCHDLLVHLPHDGPRHLAGEAALQQEEQCEQNQGRGTLHEERQFHVLLLGYGLLGGPQVGALSQGGGEGRDRGLQRREHGRRDDSRARYRDGQAVEHVDRVQHDGHVRDARVGDLVPPDAAAELVGVLLRPRRGDQTPRGSGTWAA
jgi:hypothetical protein